MNKLTWERTAKLVSQGQIIRREQEQRNMFFSCPADHEQDWETYLVDLLLCVMTTYRLTYMTSSTIAGGRGCNIFVPVLGGNSTKIALTGDMFDQPPGQIRLIRGKLAHHVGDHVVSSPEGAILVTSPGTKSSYPRPPQSLNPSHV